MNMKLKGVALFYFVGLAAALMLTAPFVSSKSFGASAQNRISGYVFGYNRQPMAELVVELRNEYYQTIERTRTNASGYYAFSGMGRGQFRVHVFTYATSYEEAENSVEIFVLTQGGYAFEQSDFYLKLRPGVKPENVVLFVQEVPSEAKAHYDKALDELENKHNDDALADLRAAIEAFPRYYDALERLGTEYVKLGLPEGYQAAAVLLALAVDINPRGYKSWYGLAYARYSLESYKDAITAAEKAIELNVYYSDAIYLYGVLLRKTGKYVEAEKQLLKAKELSKDAFPKLHWELALIYGNQMKRYADAAKELKSYLKAQPDVKDAENIKKLIADFEAKALKS